MATRIKEWEIPYTWWIGIEITNNHVINVLLRKMNNLIHVNDDRELYVDLQLDAWIRPNDDFPVWVTTGRILQSDWWQQSWLILNWKTTSGDYNRLIYANDWNLYIDLGDWIWRLLWEWSSMFDCNTRTFYLPIDVIDLVEPNLAMIQEAMDWYHSTKNAILWFNDEMFVFENNDYESLATNPYITYISEDINSVSWESRGIAYYWYDKLKIYFEDWTTTVKKVERLKKETDEEAHWVWFIPASQDLRNPFMATYDSDPISKAYLDIELAKKQDVLTPWTRISIVVDPNTGNTVISADVSWVMTYKGNVTDSSQLPTTWNNQWDCWYDETAKTLRAWDWTQWNDVGWTGIDLTNYFNKQTDTTDNIVQWNTNLFVTQQEKLTWNGKQDKLTAWDNITIDINNVISAIDTKYTAGHWIEIDWIIINNTLWFEPGPGSMWQYLKKTNDWYAWADLPWGSGGIEYTAWTWIEITANHVINNTMAFNPTNQWSVGQVLKKSGPNSYYRANESWGWGWGWGGWGGNFNPDHNWSEWQVLTKGTGSHYDWKTLELPSGNNNVKFWTIDSNNPNPVVLKEIADWVQANAQNWAIINDIHKNDIFVYNSTDTTWANTKVIFLWVNRNSQIHEWSVGWVSRWYYTIAWQWELDIIEWTTYSVNVWENPNDLTHTNYISALWANYPAPFMPTEWTQPATKAYVDAVAAWTVSVWALTNNTSWTNLRLTQEWVGTQAQYDALVNNNQVVNGVVYNIIPS